MTWTTKEGVEIDVSDMENGHLLNTVRFLERNHGVHNAANIESGELIRDHDNWYPRPGDLGVCSLQAFALVEIYEEMLDELSKRGLQKLEWENG